MSNDLPDWSNTVYQLDTNLTGSPINYVNGTQTVTFTVPTGVHLLSITLPTPGDVTFLLVSGNTTNARYLQVNPQLSSFATTYYVFIPYLVDQQVKVQVNATGSGQAFVNGVSAPLAVADLPQNPAPWQAPTFPSNPISFANPGPGGTAVVLTAPGVGVQLWLHSMWWAWTVASLTMTGTWGDSAGLVVGNDVAVTAGTPRYMDFKGAKINENAAFQFKQIGAAAANTTTCFGSVTYSVY